MQSPRQATMDSPIPTYIIFPTNHQAEPLPHAPLPPRRNSYSDARLHSADKIDILPRFAAEEDARADTLCMALHERWSPNVSPSSSPVSPRCCSTTVCSLPPALPRRTPERIARKGLRSGLPLPISARSRRIIATNSASKKRDEIMASQHHG